MKYAYSNDGNSYRGVEEGWKLAADEVVFDHIATETELILAFPDYLSIVRSAQAAIVGSHCAAAITGGFISSALGSPHTYPSDSNHQANIAVNVLSSMYPSLPGNWTTLQSCCDADGKWLYRPHTAAQIQQLGLDGKAAILACLIKNDGLQKQIAAAVDVPSVKTIIW